jgi:hypothetical protein
VKVKGIYTEMTSICESLQQTMKQCNQDFIAASFVVWGKETSSGSLGQLKPSFIYAQIFKEIRLEMKDDEQSIKDFILLWRYRYEFERDYCPKPSIWWYTRVYFAYQTFNQALRTLEASTIINIGFFIRHLHQQIGQLY